MLTYEHVEETREKFREMTWDYGGRLRDYCCICLRDLWDIYPPIARGERVSNSFTCHSGGGSHFYFSHFFECGLVVCHSCVDRIGLDKIQERARETYETVEAQAQVFYSFACDWCRVYRNSNRPWAIE